MPETSSQEITRHLCAALLVLKYLSYAAGTKTLQGSASPTLRETPKYQEITRKICFYSWPVASRATAQNAKKQNYNNTLYPRTYTSAHISLQMPCFSLRETFAYVSMHEGTHTHLTSPHSRKKKKVLPLPVCVCVRRHGYTPEI